ncbi:hypothetical protein LZC95_53405 [Pendulispora brunnea]|uniref:Uncharacterized protein n=1 Tax=Pendulispora brunnea TaxID=2905690 RepID=A0ABZ2K937_9BACT
MPSIPPRPSQPSRPPSQPPLSDLPPQASRLTRFGSAVGVALVASVLASGPAALRVTSSLEARGIWPGLAAATLVPMIVSVLTLRQARVGLRAFSLGDGRKRSWSLFLWVGFVFFTLLAFGAMLRATTHHHALAGATFAILTGAAAIVLVPISLRLGSIAARWQSENRRVLLAAFVVVLLAGALGVMLVLARILPGGASGATPAVSANLVDVLAFAMAALLASRPEFEARRTLALFGPPVAAALFIFGVRYLSASPIIGVTVDQRAPAFGPAVSILAAPDRAPETGSTGRAQQR